MAWIKFHGEIRRGKHRGIPRALRFVFLELAHEARPGRGILDLPAGMTALDGVHDILGGDRREVARALELYAAGPDRDAPSIIIEGEPGALRLRIPSWEAWNRVDDAAARTREWRQKKRFEGGCDASQARHVTVTTSQVGDGSDVTVTALDPDTDPEEKREEIPPTPRGGQARGSAPAPGVDQFFEACGSGAGEGADPAKPAAPARSSRPPREPKGPTAEQRTREAFEGGVRDGAPGEEFDMLPGKVGGVLGQMMRRAGGAEPYTWLRSEVARWRRTADPAYAGGWTPIAFVKWRNAGGSGAKPRPGAAGSTLQQPAPPGTGGWQDRPEDTF